MIEKFLGLPPLASQHGADVDKLIWYVHLLMGALFVGWLAYFLYVVFRFRQSRNPKASYVGVKSHASSYIEGAVAFVEAVLLIGFAVPLWSKAVDSFPAGPQATQIHVIAEQFSWSVRYPGADGQFGRQDLKLISSTNAFGVDFTDPASADDLSTGAAIPVNEVTVPVNKPVIAYITSKDVIHSFKVNPLRVTQDAIPGLRVPVWFTPTVEGQYLINCAQLCGNSHAFMKGYLNVLSQTNFDAWIAEKTRAAKSSADQGSFE